jgi:hypothetical protein
MLAATVVLWGLPSRAADFSVNAGFLEVVAIPLAHAGFYPYLGGAVTEPVGPVAVVGSLSLEWSPDQGRGGVVAVGTLDIPLNSRIGIDVNLAFIHDQPGLRFAESEFYLGGGPGVSLFFGRLTVSPFLSCFFGLKTPGLSVVPGLNIAWTL